MVHRPAKWSSPNSGKLFDKLYYLRVPAKLISINTTTLWHVSQYQAGAEFHVQIWMLLIRCDALKIFLPCFRNNASLINHSFFIGFSPLLTTYFVTLIYMSALLLNKTYPSGPKSMWLRFLWVSPIHVRINARTVESNCLPARLLLPQQSHHVISLNMIDRITLAQ